MDLDFRVVEERARAQIWLGFDKICIGYLTKKECGVYGFDR